MITARDITVTKAARFLRSVGWTITRVAPKRYTLEAPLGHISSSAGVNLPEWRVIDTAKLYTHYFWDFLEGIRPE